MSKQKAPKQNGGARSGAGRKFLPEDQRQSSSVNVRMTLAERQEVDHAATLEAKELSAFARQAILDKARRVVGRKQKAP